MSEHPSRFDLISWRVEDLPPTKQQAVGDHVAHCPECQEILVQVAAVAEEQESRLEERLAEFDARLEMTISSRRRTVYRNLGRGLGLAASVALILWLGFALNTTSERSDPSTYTGLKGNLNFQVVAKRGPDQFRVEPDAVLHADDALRFILITDRDLYVEVFSVGPGGLVSPFYPDNEPAVDPSPLWIEGPGRHDLPGSIVLDHVTGIEYYVVVYSEAKFDRNKVRKLVHKTHFKEVPTSLEKLEADSDLRMKILRVNKSMERKN